MLEVLKKVDFIFIEVDDNTDKTDTAQLCTCQFFLRQMLPRGARLTVVRMKHNWWNGLDTRGESTLWWTGLHPQFIYLLPPTPLISHTAFSNVCWAPQTDLEQGRQVAFQRQCTGAFMISEEITTFLHSTKQKNAEARLNRRLDDHFMADVCFASDIFKGTRVAET